MNRERSNDYIDGLQTAYKIVYKLFERAKLQDFRNAYQSAMVAINEEIENVSHDKPRIITI